MEVRSIRAGSRGACAKVSAYAAAARAFRRRSRRLMRRHLSYLLPRLLRIFAPGYHPARIEVPPRITHALAFFRQDGPIGERLMPAAD